MLDSTTAEGWQLDVSQPDPRRLEATFTSPGGRTEVTIELTENAITSSTRSVTTG